MATIVFAGCGSLAIGAAEKLNAKGHRCIGIRRQIEKLPAFIEGISADLSEPDQCPELPNSLDYLVITLTPGEFNEAAYQKSYVGGVRNLLQQLASQGIQPRRIFFASSTSVYHQHDSEWVDESSPTAPTSFSGKAMLEAESLIQASGFSGTTIRFSGIYGPGRERMIRWAQAGASAPAQPVHYSNRIHQADCVRVICHFIEQDLVGGKLDSCYLASDEEPSTFHDVLAWLRGELGVAVNPDAVEAQRIRTGSKRCDSRGLKATGFEFAFPNFREGYRPMLEAVLAND